MRGMDVCPEDSDSTPAQPCDHGGCHFGSVALSLVRGAHDPREISDKVARVLVQCRLHGACDRAAAPMPGDPVEPALAPVRRVTDDLAGVLLSRTPTAVGVAATSTQLPASPL